VRRGLAQAVAQLLAIAITVWIAPGVSAAHGWTLIVAAVLVALVSWALRPALAWVARRLGWTGAALIALFAQAIILGLALAFTPGMTVESLWVLVLASWIYGAIAAVLMWVFAISGDEYVIANAVRLANRRPLPMVDGTEGVLFIQLDGVPAPVLE